MHLVTKGLGKNELLVKMELNYHKSAMISKQNFLTNEFAGAQRFPTQADNTTREFTTKSRPIWPTARENSDFGYLAARPASSVVCHNSEYFPVEEVIPVRVGLVFTQIFTEKYPQVEFLMKYCVSMVTRRI